MRAVDEGGAGRSIAPALKDAIAALSAGGHWAIAFDDQWSLVAVSDDFPAETGDEHNPGSFFFGEESFELRRAGVAGGNSVNENRATLRHLAPWMLQDFPGGRETLRELLHPELRSIVDEVEPTDSEAATWEAPSTYHRTKIGSTSVAQRIRDSRGHIVGTVVFSKPGVSMNTLGMLTASADVEHLQRMFQLARADRRPAAVLFADLEGSAQLSKRMPTAAYFTLVRRMTRAADQCVLAAGGLVGRHVGDGVAAFFVAEAVGSESAAASACIAAASALRSEMVRIAERQEIDATDVTVRAGLHWGSRLYIGAIITPGRSEVTALGDEVNEAARIEACATGGRILASKDLIERLEPVDAATIGIDPDKVTYTQLADLDTATDKARRDAPSIAVYDVNAGA